MSTRVCAIRARLLALTLGVLASASALAQDAVPPGYRAIAAEYGLPDRLLYAVALTESGRPIKALGARRPWPWTLNVAGRGYFYPTREEALAALTRFLAEGRESVDIGLMQVNWRHHRHRLGSPEAALEPYRNLRVAAAILSECSANRGDWWAGVGCYHAPADAERAARYRRRVAAHLRWLGPAG